jgi:predicted exporter
VNPRRSLLLLALVLAGMTVVITTRLTFGTNITNLMPSGTPGTLADISRRLTETELSRTMVLCIGAPDLDTAVAAAREFAAALRMMPDVAWVRSGVDPDVLNAVYQIYFPRRFYFLSDDPARIAELTSGGALRAQAARTKAELALPTAPLLKRLVASDPLGGFRRILERFQGQQPPLDTRDGQFVTRDGRFAVLFLGTKPSAFDGKSQRRLLAELQARFDAIAAKHPGPLTLEKSGANLFAVAIERSIRGEVDLAMGLAVLSVLLWFHAFFRSGRSLLLTAVPMVSGLVVATGLGVLVFGHLDGLTLGFGAALIGVVVDYPTFLLCHLCFSPHRGDVPGTLRRTRPSIALGGLTTMASFAGLGFTSFPGFREIAFFSVVGVGVALVVTLFVLPPLVPPQGREPALSRAVSRALGSVVLWLAPRRRVLAGIAGGLLAVAVPLLPRLIWVDDLTKLWHVNPALLAEDRQVRERVSQFDTSRFVIALAPDEEEALVKNDALHTTLTALVAKGELGGMRSLHSFLWSQKLQRENRAALLADPGLGARVIDAFSAEGFRANAFAGFSQALADESTPPLVLGDLSASPLADLVRPLFVELGSDTALITYLQDVRDPTALSAALAPLAGVHFFDQRQFLNDVYAEFRMTTLEQLFIGNGLVILFLLVRYRRLRPAVAAFFPCSLVALFLLGSFAALGVETNLLHVVGLDMVMGMGVDYGIFVVDSAQDPEEMGTTMLSVFVGSFTAILTFGVLAISQHPALRALGITIGGGLFLSFLLAPLALLLVEPPKPRAHA